jgi:predicted PurR-regulated permease PerM
MPLPEEYRRHSFLLLGASLIVASVALLLWSTWLMVSPFLIALVWAVCCAAVLRSVKQPLTRALVHLSRRVPRRAKVALGVTLASVYLVVLFTAYDNVWPGSTLAERVVFVTLALSVGVVALIPFAVSTDTFATLSILALTIVGMSFFAFFVVRTCYAESVVAVQLIRGFLDNYIEQVRSVAAKEDSVDFAWRHAFDACDRLPTHIPLLSLYLDSSPRVECSEWLTNLRAKAPEYAAQAAAFLASNVQWIGDKMIGGFKGVVDVVGTVGDFFFATFIFASLLFYFVKNDRAIAVELHRLSPFDATENQLILSVLHDKVLKTFKLSLLLATFRFLVALACFTYAAFDVRWVFSFASGFLAIVPVLSSWLIWLPASIVLVARDGFWSTGWVVMVGAHMLAYVADYGLYSWVGVGDQKPEVIGMAFVMGVYAFGAYGVLIGPLVSGAMLALVDIYKVYLPPPQDDGGDDSELDRHAEAMTRDGLGAFTDGLRKSVVDSTVTMVSNFVSPVAASRLRKLNNFKRVVANNTNDDRDDNDDNDDDSTQLERTFGSTPRHIKLKRKLKRR